MLLPYSESIEQAMKCVFAQLSEQGRRLYAAVEAQKLPRGGQHYIAELLGCTAKTLRRGCVNSPIRRRCRRRGGFGILGAGGNGCWIRCPNWMGNSRRSCRNTRPAIR